VQDRECLLGQIVDQEISLSEAGKMVQAAWEALAGRFSTVALDEFVVMPNHVHGIVWIVGASLVDAQDGATTRVAPTLGDVVGAFKSITTNAYIRGVEADNWPRFPGRLWQRNYYEHIVRNDDELRRIRQYVADNPAKWALDPENPARG
jgi:REP element-mobilizing transposase RayT